MIFNKISMFFTVIVLSFVTSQGVKAELFLNRDIPKETSQLLAGLAFFENFTEIESSDDLRSKYNLVAVALNLAAKQDAGTDEAKTALDKASSAYTDFLKAYGTQLNKLKEISDGSFDEIFEAIDWSSAEYAACSSYRGELLDLLKAATDTITANQIQGGSLNVELAECEARLNAASRKLDSLVVAWEAEIDEKRKTVAELKVKHAEAVAAGKEEQAQAIQNEIDKIEDEEIPKLERKVEKSKKVKSSFSLEKLLKGLGKIALGIVTIIFSGECGEKAKASCSSLGVSMITDGVKDVGDAFDPPDETVTYEETKTEKAERSSDVIKQEGNIKEAVKGKSEPLCCKPTDIKPKMTLVKSDEKGALSFGYESANGAVSKIYLIKNNDGSILAEIEDKKLFFTKGAELPDVKTSLFSSLNKAETQKTDGGTHLVKFEGTLVTGGKAALGIAISPLTFSGKFKVTLRPVQ